LELLEAMLAFDPKDRITAEAGLAHPYLAMYHVPDDEPAHTRPFDFTFELTNTIPEIKSILFLTRIDFVGSTKLSGHCLWKDHTSCRRYRAYTE
jgi:serine/threonine protein kinase